METKVATRDDPRYVRQRAPDAQMHAWAGDDLTMPMGGWTDTDEAAFCRAVKDELRYGSGSDDAVDWDIHVIQRDEDGEIICCHGE